MQGQRVEEDEGPRELVGEEEPASCQGHLFRRVEPLVPLLLLLYDGRETLRRRQQDHVLQDGDGQDGDGSIPCD